jgi:kinesin family protein C1
MTEQIKRLKLCIKWFQQVDENHVLEKQKLQSAIESVEKKCKDNGKV